MTTEKELIERACRGDSAAFMLLFEKYQPIVFKNQRKYYVKDLEPEDWHQEGRLVFFKTLKCYDESRGVSLGFFFKTNFERHVFSLLRRQGAEKRKIDYTSTSLEDKLEQQGEHFIYGEQTAEEASFAYVELRDTLTDFYELLSPLEQKVFYYFLVNQPIPEISLTLNITERKVANAMDRVKSKFKNKLK